MNYKVRAVQEFMNGREVWTAEHPDLLGCHALGRTCLEATTNLSKVRGPWLRFAKDHGATVPAPPKDFYMDVVFDTP